MHFDYCDTLSTWRLNSLWIAFPPSFLSNRSHCIWTGFLLPNQLPRQLIWQPRQLFHSFLMMNQISPDFLQVNIFITFITYISIFRSFFFFLWQSSKVYQLARGSMVLFQSVFPDYLINLCLETPSCLILLLANDSIHFCIRCGWMWWSSHDCERFTHSFCFGEVFQLQPVVHS